MSEKDLAWTTRPMRWGQINIREIEPPDFDVAWWEDYWRRIHLDGITLNAGGLVAYYPTKLKDQHRSRWLGERDLFGELVQAVKRCNMKVLARIDPGESYEDVYFRHPDWFAVDENGTPMRDHEGGDQLYIPCMNGPYYWEFVPEIMKEIHSNYEVDGTFCSEWDGRNRVCHCPRCKEMFKGATGLDLPRNTRTEPGIDPRYPTQMDPADMAWKQWVAWHQKRLEDLWLFWDRLNKGIKPGVFWMGNHSDQGFLADYAEMINVDNQSRREQHPLWAVGEQGKKMRAITQGKKPYFHIFSSNSYSRHVAKPSAEYRLYIADSILADSRPWFTIIGGIQWDKRQFQPLEDMYRWHHKNESYLRDRESLAEVAIAFYDRTRFIPKEKRVGDNFRGMYYAMLRNRIPFDLVHVARMDEAVLSKYKLLILPNIGALSEEEAENVRKFVKSGGSVISTYETGLYNEWGQMRTSGVLDDLFGIVRRFPSLGPLSHSYAHLHGAHELLSGLEDTEVTHNSDYLCPVQAKEGTNASLVTLIPPYISYPPEMAYSLIGDTGVPLVLLTERATKDEGRRVYWSGNIDAYFNTTNSPDYQQLLLNSVRWAFPGEQPVEIGGPGLIEMHPYRQNGNIQVHLVNLTNPDIWKAPVHELLPVGPQTIRVKIPQSQCVASEAKCLVSERTLPVEIFEGWAQVTLTDLLDHEIVVFDLK